MGMMDLDYRPSERRKLYYRSEMGPDTILSATGDDVYSLTRRGIIVAAGKSRTLVNWARVLDLTWDVADRTISEWMEKN